MPVIPYQKQAQERGLPGVAEQSAVSSSEASIPGKQIQQLGASVQGIGDSLLAIDQKRIDRENADMLFRAETSLRDGYMQFEQQARQRRGQNAWNITQDAQSWWDENTEKFAEGLTNETQRFLFEKTAVKMRQQSVSGFARYEEDQRIRSLEESTTAALNTLVNQASLTASYLGPNELGSKRSVESVLSMKADGLKRIDLQAKNLGWGSDRRKLERDLFTTKFHKQVIQTKIDTNPSASKAYYDLNKDEILGSERLNIENLISKGEIKTQAQDYATSSLNQGISESEALRAVRNDFSGEQEQIFAQEIRAQYGEISAANTRDQKEAADEAYQAYAKTGRISSIPSEVMSRMDGKTLIALRTLADNDSKGVSTKTDNSVYYALQLMAADEPKKFAEEDLRKYFHKLSPSDQQEFARLQANISKPGSSKDLRTLPQQYSQAFMELDLKSKDQEERGQFMRFVNNELFTLEQDKQRPLNYKERQDVIDRAMFEVELEDSGFFIFPDTDKRVFEMTPTERSKYELSPDGDTRKLIIEALRLERIPATNKNIQERFNLKMGIK